jgi:hypothetical protein
MADPVLSLQIDTPSASTGLGYLIIDDAVNGLIDSGLIAPDVIFSEKIKYARSIHTQRGVTQFQGPTVRADTGTLTSVLSNQNRAFDPTTSSDIVPGRAVKFQVTYNAITYDVFTGVIHAWNLAYPGQGVGGDATTTINANDGLAQLTSLNIAENRPQELTGARINSVANLIGWPATLRAINPGITVMPASGQSISAASSMLLAADSDMGELTVSAAGVLTFRDRDHIVMDARSQTSQATYGTNPGELLFQNVNVSFDDTQLRNKITVIYNDAGAAATATDSTSMSQYGEWYAEIQARIVDPAVAAGMAQFLVAQYSQPLVRIDSIVIKPFRDPVNLFPQVLGRQLGDRVTVVFQPPGGGPRISHECFVRGISHDLTAVSSARDWTTTFVMQDAFTWPHIFTIDSSVIDGTDVLWF